jgi:hypothetical protein
MMWSTFSLSGYLNPGPRLSRENCVCTPHCGTTCPQITDSFQPHIRQLNPARTEHVCLCFYAEVSDVCQMKRCHAARDQPYPIACDCGSFDHVSQYASSISLTYLDPKSRQASISCLLVALLKAPTTLSLAMRPYRRKTGIGLGQTFLHSVLPACVVKPCKFLVARFIRLNSLSSHRSVPVERD